MPRLSQSAALFLAAGLAATSARASVLSWANVAGGSASLASNWSPNQAPVAGDDLTFNMLANYGVTFNASVTASNSHLYKKGTVNVTASSPHTIATGMTVGDVSGDNATMTLTSGTVVSNGFSRVGDASGAVGVLNVNSSVADLIFGGNLFVGNAGTGTMNVTNLGHVQVGGAFLPGVLPTGVATTTVSGSLASPPFGNSFLDVVGLSESRIGQLGDAAFTVSNGALAAFAANLVVAHQSSSTSSITVQNAGLLPARLNVAGDLSVGRNTAAALAAGDGTLTVNTGGAATINGALFIGNDPDGGTGLLHVAGTGAVTAHGLVIGTGGTFQFNNGTVTVNGGVFSQAVAPVNISDSAGTPHLVLQNGTIATLLSSGGPVFRAMNVGGPGASADGLVSILSGSQVELSAAGAILVAIGEDSDDRGEVDVDGPGSKLFSNSTSSQILVGAGGIGTLNVTNHGSVSVAAVAVGSQVNAFGVVSVQDSGSMLEVTRDMFVGGSAAGDGGFGQLFVRAGGLVQVTDSTVSTLVYDQGLISIADSAFTSSGIITVLGGAIGLDNGILNATEVRLDGGQLGGDGNVNARINMSNSSLLIVGSTAVPSVPQDLTVGIPTTTAGFTSVGSSTIQVNDQSSLTIQDLNRADGEVIILNNGTINAPNGLRLHATANVSGRGLINADVDFTFGGSIACDSAGIRFGGVLTRSGGTMSGTTFGFNNGGGYTGNGTIGAIVDFDAGSVCTNTGILTMGNAASNFGVTMDGTLHCGNGTVTLLDANGVGLGTLTDLNGGNLVCTQNLTVNFGKTIEGTGFVQTPLLTVNGSIKPADLPSQPPHRGTLNVSGAITMGANNNYFCDIDPGIEFATADRIQSSGPAVINGALTVAFIDGYVPQGNQMFDIVVGSSRTGTFSSTTFPPVGAFGPPRVEYLADRARIIMCYVNCDGSAVSPTLTANDFQCFLNKFSAQDPYANCDGSTATPLLTANDFQCFLNKFSAGCN